MTGSPDEPASRPITPLPPLPPLEPVPRQIEVGFSRSYIGLHLLLIPLTLGIVPLFLWWYNRRLYPWTIDREGIVRRDGVRVIWKDLDQVAPFSHSALGPHDTGGVDLGFHGVWIRIHPFWLDDGFAVLNFVRLVSRWPGGIGVGRSD
ncbi:MAG: hypothetical protein GX442_10615 [Candidatus Riflebacteria bacterium]|nr:hypothetical protein [Candidatus Riflebacteria bacterium]